MQASLSRCCRRNAPGDVKAAVDCGHQDACHGMEEGGVGYFAETDVYAVTTGNRIRGWRWSDLPIAGRSVSSGVGIFGTGDQGRACNGFTSRRGAAKLAIASTRLPERSPPCSRLRICRRVEAGEVFGRATGPAFEDERPCGCIGLPKARRSQGRPRVRISAVRSTCLSGLSLSAQSTVSGSSPDDP